LAFVLTENV
jgi:hypothetical protein